MKLSLRIFLIICFLSEANLVFPAQRKMQSFVDYINQYSSIALRQRDKYKIPASIILAQGLLESQAGASALAQASNNHFGIKCHDDWQGEKVYYNDDRPNECFRKYKSVEDSYNDHSKFLQQHSRYAILFTYNTRDYTSWAKGLQTCGYATDKGYANKIIAIIEDYQLYEYDTKPSLKNSESDRKSSPVLLRDVYMAYNMLYIVAKANDSFDQIAYDTGFKVKDLAKYNEVPDYFPLEKGDIVWLEKKKKKADKPNLVHIVKIGESIHSISQRYGIQMKHLYKMNKKDWDYAPTEGDVLRLR